MSSKCNMRFNARIDQLLKEERERALQNVGQNARGVLAVVGALTGARLAYKENCGDPFATVLGGIIGVGAGLLLEEMFAKLSSI